MKVWLKAPAHISKAMHRVAVALQVGLPDGWTTAPTLEEAELVVFHTIDYADTKALAEECWARGQQVVIIQYCLRTTQQPDACYWLPIWKRCAAVWSYYDLPALTKADGGKWDGVRFFHAPLGVDVVFAEQALVEDHPRELLTTCTGFVAESECLDDIGTAVQLLEGRGAHVGHELHLGLETHLQIPDEAMVALYKNSRTVMALRRTEGFELPAIEGLVCGARPIAFQATHYYQWLGDQAIYIPELPSGTPTVNAIVQAIRAAEARPVTRGERLMAAAKFAWVPIVREFWKTVQAGVQATEVVHG